MLTETLLRIPFYVGRCSTRYNLDETVTIGSDVTDTILCHCNGNKITDTICNGNRVTVTWQRNDQTMPTYGW